MIKWLATETTSTRGWVLVGYLGLIHAVIVVVGTIVEMIV